ncbi:MAG: hypothetical protein ABIV51_02070 [Saprospiraceae bacterium]
MNSKIFTKQLLHKIHVVAGDVRENRQSSNSFCLSKYQKVASQKSCEMVEKQVHSIQNGLQYKKVRQQVYLLSSEHNCFLSPTDSVA